MKNFKVRHFLVLLGLVALSLNSQAEVLKGTVRDSEGAAISRAIVYVHWDASGSKVGLTTNRGILKDVKVITGKKGEFTIELPPGFYDVFVTADAFQPQCQKVRLHSGETKTFNPNLKVETAVTKELGDQF